jgi:hypothetical protein
MISNVLYAYIYKAENNLYEVLISKKCFDIIRTQSLT